jgi:hypothetical protein
LCCCFLMLSPVTISKSMLGRSQRHWAMLLAIAWAGSRTTHMMGATINTILPQCPTLQSLQSTWFVPSYPTLQLPYLLLLWYTPSHLGLKGFWWP